MFSGSGQSVFGDNGYLNRAREAESQLDSAYAKIRVLSSDLSTVNELKTTAIELVGTLVPTLAGIRGVLREALVELKYADPTNPLLKKMMRDSIFSGVYKKQARAINGKELSAVKNLVRTGEIRDEVFGSKNATEGGPEESLLKPNNELRILTSYPSNHISDREKMVDLINRLAAEIRKNEPSTAVLKSIISEAK